jgi:hypothetical protein
MFKAVRSYLSIYIHNDTMRVEVFYLPFPRFVTGRCEYETLLDSCREKLDEALKSAQQIARRFNSDYRFDATSEELKKAFDRN